MNKQAFLAALEKELREKRVEDPAEIMGEYEQHFAFKLADGFSEEEIAAKLGSPADIAAQYEEGAAPPAPPKGGRKAVLVTGLCFADLFAAMLWIVLGAVVLVIGAFAVACAGGAVMLLLGLNVASLLPAMPYFGAAILGVSLLCLAALAAVGTVYCALYLSGWTGRYLAWRRSLLSGDTRPAGRLGRPIGPVGKARRILRSVALCALIGFVATFVIYTVAMFLYADFRPFWHALGWFGYTGQVG